MQPRLTGPAAVLSREIDALHNDLLAFAAKTERWFVRIDERFDRLDEALHRLHFKGNFVAELRRDIVDAVRQALRECGQGG